MDRFITQIVGPASMTSQQRKNEKKQLRKKKESFEKKESVTSGEQYAAVYIPGETEIQSVTYHRPK